MADASIAQKRRDGLSLSGYERDFVALSRGGQGFDVVSGATGIDSIRDARSGAALVDLDNDGDLDIVRRPSTGDSSDPALLVFRNNVGAENGWVRFTLEGRASGREALGATVRIGTPHGTQTALRAAGSGFAAQWDPRLHLGLGAATGTDWVEVTWPGGETQRFPGVPTRTAWTIVEGTDNLVPAEEPLGSLPDSAQ